MAFNKGPAYGLSAEVKNKVGGRFSRNAQSKTNFLVSSWAALVEPNHLGLHFDVRVHKKGSQIGLTELTKSI